MSDTPGHSHMQDPEGHVDAVASDLEYFRRKRIEPRLLLYLRRGIITWRGLFAAHGSVSGDLAGTPTDLEARIRALEDSLDSLILDIASVTTISLANHDVTIDDNRTERGDYHPEFRLASRSYEGDLRQRITLLEAAIADAASLVAALAGALVAAGETSVESLADNRRRLSEIGHGNGARIVARAWTNPDFRERLLRTGRRAVRELDIPPGRLGKLGVAENTADIHNVVVCTLCSCYPHDLLGNPPWWYRTDEYKQRIVQDPRQMLSEMFGLDIDPERSIVVHDSTSDVRWMVLPLRPEGTDGMSEEELAALVTPGSLVGSEEIAPP